jgi:hypothetical protein
MDLAPHLAPDRLRDDPAVAPLLVRPGLATGRRPASIATGVAALDRLLDGGFPAGCLSELVGPRTSGRTRLLLGLLARATAGGALVALVDAADGLDPGSARLMGVELARLLWVRCGGRLALAWQAADILLRGGGFRVVAVDLGDLPPWALLRTPAGVFVRLQRAVERTPAALLLAGPRRVAGSLAALAVALRSRGAGWARGGPGLLAGLQSEARLVRTRTRAPGAGVRLHWETLP